MLTKICAGRKANFASSDSDGLSTRAILMQILVCVLANLSILSPGMGLGFPAIVSQFMIEDGTLTVEQVSWFASITAIACPIGGLLAGMLCDRIGRKGTIVVTDVVSIIQWILIAFSSTTDSERMFAELMIARVLTGICIGMSATPVIIYLSEVCHPKIRGSILVLAPFMLSLGTLIVYVIEDFITDFRVVSLYALAITVFALVVLLLVPETPVYLITKNRHNEARSVLSMLRNAYKYDATVEEEIRKIQEAREASCGDGEGLSLLRELKKPETYKPLAIMLLFMIIQQLSGIYVLFIFAAKFAREAGVTINEFIATNIIGLMRCIGTLLIGYVSDVIGRKAVAVISSSGMFLSMIGLTLCSLFPTGDSPLFWLPTALLFVFCFIGTLGVLTLPFSMIGEVFPQKTRGFGVGVCLSFTFFLSFFTIKTFADVFEIFGNSVVFLFYALVALFGIFFSMFVLPETKGKTLQQIENYFRK